MRSRFAYFAYSVLAFCMAAPFLVPPYVPESNDATRADLPALRVRRAVLHVGQGGADQAGQAGSVPSGTTLSAMQRDDRCGGD